MQSLTRITLSFSSLQSLLLQRIRLVAHSGTASERLSRIPEHSTAALRSTAAESSMFAMFRFYGEPVSVRLPAQNLMVRSGRL